MIWLRDIDQSMKELGDKARFLGEMFNKVLVPNGFVVEYEFFEKFLNRTGLRRKVEEALNSGNKSLVRTLIREEEMPEELKNELYDAYKAINVSKDLAKVGETLNFIKAGQENPYVAVRVSGSKTPGHYNYSINVSGKKELIDAVKQCWISAIDEEKFSVIVQKMCDSDKGGVMFTANPVDNDSSIIVVEANLGLPESVTAALCVPDYYIIDKDSGEVRKRIAEKNICVRRSGQGETERITIHKDDKNKQVLDENDLKKLKKLAEKVETHFNKPQNIEFGFERNRLFMLQTRPIEPVKHMGKEVEGKRIAKGFIISPGLAEGEITFESEAMNKISVVDIFSSCKGPTIAENGSILCNAAIEARKKEIPVIIVPEVKNKIKEGLKIILNAYKGEIIEKIEETQKIEEIESTIHPTSPLSQELSMQTHQLSQPQTMVQPQSVVATKLGIILAESDSIYPDVDSVVFEVKRSPYHLFEEGREHEFTQRLLHMLLEPTKKIYPKPFWYKSIDVLDEGGLLGFHGLRKNLSILVKAELEVLKALHHQGLTNIHYLLSFVSDVNELRRVKEIARSLGLPLSIKFGITIETPAAALTIDNFCREGVDFIFFNPISLMQLSLGVDRNSQSSQLFTPDHPSVLRQIEYVVNQCKKNSIETSILVPENQINLINYFIKLGVDSIFTVSDDYQQARVEIARAERRLLLDRKRQEQF